MRNEIGIQKARHSFAEVVDKGAADIFDYKPLNSNEGSLQSIASIIVWSQELLLQVYRNEPQPGSSITSKTNYIP